MVTSIPWGGITLAHTVPKEIVSASFLSAQIHSCYYISTREACMFNPMFHAAFRGDTTRGFIPGSLSTFPRAYLPLLASTAPTRWRDVEAIASTTTTTTTTSTTMTTNTTNTPASAATTTTTAARKVWLFLFGWLYAKLARISAHVL